MEKLSQWIGLWNGILFFREADCGMGITVPKSTASWNGIYLGALHAAKDAGDFALIEDGNRKIAATGSRQS